MRASLRPRTVDSTASLRNVCKTLHNEAVVSTARGRSGSHIAHSRIACARPISGSRMERAGVRFASPCGGVAQRRVESAPSSTQA
eukprot:1468543-Lingulodinium_polyedra.AAC.1